MTLACSWRELSASIGYFSFFCDWQNVLCSFLPSTTDRTNFDCAQTRILTKIRKNNRKTKSIQPQYFRCTEGRPKKPSFPTEGVQYAFQGSKESNPMVKKFRQVSYIFDSEEGLKVYPDKTQSEVLGASDALGVWTFQRKHI